MKLKLDFELPTCGSVHCDDARSIAVIRNGRIYINEDELDIFSVTEKDIPKWEPTNQYKKYQELTYIIVDIETLRIDNSLKGIRDKARNNRVMSIGLMNERGETIIIQDESERWMLEQYQKVIEKKQPDLLIGFNSMKFDLPFLLERFNQHRMKCIHWINYESIHSRFAPAVIAGRPWDAPFRAVHTRLASGKKVMHIDCYMLAVKFDSVMRKFEKYTLKAIPLQMGLRNEARLDLGNEGIEECYTKGDWGTLHRYLIFDLEDTKLLADRFVPEVINEQSYFPEFNIQALATVGVGTRWQSGMSEDYPSEYIASLPDPISLKFQGALTYASPLFSKNVVSYDFSGQYPTCMIQYGICSIYDNELSMLKRMQHGMDYRANLKYKENPSQAEVEFVTTVKSLINGAYGALAAKIPFGDPVAAALVTAFARARLKWSKKFIEAMGGRVVLTDTDSLFIQTDKTDIHLRYSLPEKLLASLPKDSSSEMLSAIAIGEVLKHYIPSGSKLDLDSINKMMFIPPSNVPSDYNKSYKFKSKNAGKLIAKNLSDDPDVTAYAVKKWAEEKVTYQKLLELSEHFGLGFPEFDAVRKNYCKISWNMKKSVWEQKAKGRFVKRVTIDLEKRFQQNYMLKYSEDPALAEDYYYSTLESIVNRSFPIEHLTVTRKISIAEIKLVELGFGKANDIVSFYMGIDGEYTQSGDYNIPYYIEKVQSMHEEIQTCLREVKALYKIESNKQLELV